MNRSRSLRSSKHESNTRTNSSSKFSFSSLRGQMTQSQMSSAMFSLIKTENNIISAYESAAKETQNLAHLLSSWGEQTEDDHISDVSDKLGVIMSELAEVEENFAGGLEDSRLTLKQIRNTEASVNPSRDRREKLINQIGMLKLKEQNSEKLVGLEQQLVRAEAENLVAEAQLTNIQRHAMKETYLIHLSAIIERSEKSLILAEHGRRILEFLDDTPVVPGDVPATYEHEKRAKQVLLECEHELHQWKPQHYESGLNTTLGANALPTHQEAFESESIYEGNISHHDHSHSHGNHTEPALGNTTSGPLVSDSSDMKFSDAQQSSRAPIAQVSKGFETSGSRPDLKTESSFDKENGESTGAVDAVKSL